MGETGPAPAGKTPPSTAVRFRDAQGIALRSATPITTTEVVQLSRGVGRVLAADLVAGDDQPARDKSAMDGYALRSIETDVATPTLPVLLSLVGGSFAGRPFPGEVSPGECVYITTGAFVPSGADAVIKVEETERIVDREKGSASVAVTGFLRGGANIIRRATYYAKGAMLLPAGSLLTPARIGLLGTTGAASVTVYRRPEVSIIPTGDELVPLGTEPKPGQIFSSNAQAVAAVVTEAGGVPRVEAPVGDNLQALEGALETATKETEVIVLLGGTWVGEKDLVARAVAGMGTVFFHGIRVRPGHTTLFGSISGKPVVGLPGSPGAALAMAYGILEPMLRMIARLPPVHRLHVRTVLATEISCPGDEDHIVPVRLQEGRAIPVTGTAMSGRVMAEADGYIHVPAEVEKIEAGAQVEVILL